MNFPSIKRPNLTTRELRILVVTVAIAFLLLNYLLVWPWWNRVIERSQELREDELDAQRQSRILQSEPEWHKELTELTQSKENHSPHAKDTDAWKRHIYLLAEESSLEDFKIHRESSSESRAGLISGTRSVGRTETKLKANQFQLGCDINGSLTEIVKFLHTLQMDSAHPRIESCSLTPMKPGEEALRGKVVFSVFLKPSGAP